jgi:hypothetical protein
MLFLVILMILSPSQIFHLCLDHVYKVSVPGVKQPGVALTTHPHQSSAKIKEIVELYLYPLQTFVACSRVNFIFYLYLDIIPIDPCSIMCDN